MKTIRHLGTQTIETKRLILRKFTLEDAQAMYDNWASDDEVTRYLTWPAHKNVEVTKSILETWVSQYENKNYYQWAIVLKSHGLEPIGCIGTVGQGDETSMVQIGYCMGKAWWHQGIMSEALEAIIAYFFQQVQVNRMECRYDVLNEHSGDVMKKCGMRFEGIKRQAELNLQGGLSDMAGYAMLACDYVEKNN